MTADLAELQAALEPSQYAALIPFSTSVPDQPPRSRDRLLVGVAIKAAEPKSEP